MPERVAFGRYRRVFECVGPKYRQYQRIFGVLSTTANMLIVILNGTATALQTFYTSDPADDGLRLASVVARLVATSMTALRTLYGFDDLAAGCEHAANLVRQHLLTREPATLATIHLVFDTNTLFLTHPTTSAECKLAGYVAPPASPPPASPPPSPPSSVAVNRPVIPPSAPRARSTDAGGPKVLVRRRTDLDLPPTAPTRQKTIVGTRETSVSIAYANYESLLRCAHEQFHTISSRSRDIHLTLMTLHILCNTLILCLQAVDAQELRTLLMVLHFIDLLLVAPTSLPLLSTSKRCRDAYVLCCQYLLTRAPMTVAVLETLYETPTFCFANPLLSDECKRFEQRVRTNPLTETDEACCGDVRVVAT